MPVSLSFALLNRNEATNGEPVQQIVSDNNSVLDVKARKFEGERNEQLLPV